MDTLARMAVFRALGTQWKKVHGYRAATSPGHKRHSGHSAGTHGKSSRPIQKKRLPRQEIVGPYCPLSIDIIF